MKKFLKYFLASLMLILFLAMLLLYRNEKKNEKVVLTEYTFRHEEIPNAFNGYKIMMISDLHEAPFANQIIEHIKFEEPDIIVFVGDLVQLPNSSIDETLKIANVINNIPMYMVSGNHETQCGAYDEVVEALWNSDIIVLDNDSVALEKGDESMLLLGVKDPEADIVTEDKIEEMKSQIESEFPDGPCFSILLMHRADLYPKVKDTGVDLILSGHLHGGIIRLPFVGGVIGQDEDWLFPEYTYGVVKEGDSSTMIIGGGCDKNPKKKRFFNPPEVVMITLEGEN